MQTGPVRLARRVPAWQTTAMPTPTRPPVAGGFPIVACILAGSAVGFVVHQPTIGFFVGAAVGIAIATALWLRDRR